MHRIIYNELIKSLKDKTIYSGFVALTFFALAGAALLRFATFLPEISFEEYLRYGFGYVITVIMPLIVISAIYRSIAEERVKGRTLIYEAFPYLKIEVFGGKVISIIVKSIIYLLFFNLTLTLLGSLILSYGMQIGAMFGQFFKQILDLLPILGLSFIALVPATIISKPWFTTLIMLIFTGGMVGGYFLKVSFSNILIVTPLIERLIKPLEVSNPYIGLSLLYIFMTFGLAFIFYWLVKPKAYKK